MLTIEQYDQVMKEWKKVQQVVFKGDCGRGWNKGKWNSSAVLNKWIVSVVERGLIIISNGAVIDRGKYVLTTTPTHDLGSYISNSVRFPLFQNRVKNGR